MRLLTSEPLSNHTTLRLGGPAVRLVDVESEDELIDELLRARRHEEPVFVLGGGSNVIVSDSGWPGLVVRPSMTGIKVQSGGERGVLAEVAAGEPWDRWIEQTVSEGWPGLVCLSGIPGAVGAAPVQNIGAYGAELGEMVESLRVLDRKRLTTEVWPAERCGFAYRSSVLRGDDRHVVLSVTFRFPKMNAQEPVRYRGLADAMGVKLGESAPLRDIRDAVLNLRRSKGMVVDPTDPDTRSAGSFFINPVLSEGQLDDVLARLHANGVLDTNERPPLFSMGHGQTKLPAAWLIERSGYPKGTRRGNVAVSSKHALALVNLGGATTSELLGLAQEIRDAVQEISGITLRREPVLVRAPAGR